MDNCDFIYYKDKLKESGFELIFVFFLCKITKAFQILILQFLTQRARCKILSLLLWSNLNFNFVYLRPLHPTLTQYHISLHCLAGAEGEDGGDEQRSRRVKIVVIDLYIPAAVSSRMDIDICNVRNTLFLLISEQQGHGASFINFGRTTDPTVHYFLQKVLYCFLNSFKMARTQ